MKNLWQNNNIQFCRLIAELDYAGIFHYNTLKKLSESMDLSHDEILEIVERATAKFDKIKSNL